MIRFFKCSHCGNVAALIDEMGPPLACCGEAMQELIANTVDAAQEKHVPVFQRIQNNLHVEIGAVPHPMTPEHHISWIAVAQGQKLQIEKLDPSQPAVAVFQIGDGSFTVLEYCNLHGLWKAEG